MDRDFGLMLGAFISAEDYYGIESDWIGLETPRSALFETQPSFHGCLVSCAIVSGFEWTGPIGTVSFTLRHCYCCCYRYCYITLITVFPPHSPIFTFLKVWAGPRSEANYVSLRRVCFQMGFSLHGQPGCIGIS